MPCILISCQPTVFSFLPSDVSSFGPMMMFPQTLQPQQQPATQQGYHSSVESSPVYTGPFPPPIPMQPPVGYPLPPMMMPPQFLEEYYRNLGISYPMNPFTQQHSHDRSNASPKSSQSRKARIDMAGIVNSSTEAASRGTLDEVPHRPTSTSTSSVLSGSGVTDGQRGINGPTFTDSAIEAPHVASDSSQISPSEKGAAAPKVGFLPVPPMPPPLPGFPYPMLHPFLYMPPPFPPPPPPATPPQHDQSHVNGHSATGNGFMGYPYAMYPPFMYPPATFPPPTTPQDLTANVSEKLQKGDESAEVHQESHHKQFHHPAMFWPYMYPTPSDTGFGSHRNSSNAQTAAENGGNLPVVDSMEATQLPPGSAEHQLQNLGGESTTVEDASADP